AAHWERVVALDPDNKQAWYLLPHVYKALDRHDDEQNAYRRSAEVFERALELDPDDVQDLIGLAAARLAVGQADEAMRAVEHALNVAGDDAAVLYNVACIYSRAGQTQKALDTLEKSFAAGLADPDWMEQDSDLDNIRDDPRYASLLANMRAATADRMEKAGN
ncbi:MAG: tetratricopeptide repeat protein, partial [Woeseia sp.]